MTTQEIVSKLWNLCNVLRDDGITYQNYLNELTYGNLEKLQFFEVTLKMRCFKS